jgi:DNA-binding response OmpR family regulator
VTSSDNVQHGGGPAPGSGDGGEQAPRLLIIEDESLQRGLISRIGSAAGFVPTISRSLDEAAARLQESSFDCITLDLSLGGEHGITDGLRLLEKLHCKTPIIIVSGATSTQLQLTSSIGKSLKLNVCETIAKPLDPSVLRAALAKVKTKLRG